MMSSLRPHRDRKSNTHGVFRIFARSMQDICKNQPCRRKLPTPNEESSPVNQGQGTPGNHKASVIQHAPAFMLKILGKNLHSQERQSIEGGSKSVSEAVIQPTDEVPDVNEDDELKKPCFGSTCTNNFKHDIAVEQGFDQSRNDSMKGTYETDVNENLVTTEVLITEESDSKLSGDGCGLKIADLSEDWETSLCSVAVQENHITELDHPHIADCIINCSTVIEEESDSEYSECVQTFCIEREQNEKQITNVVDNNKEGNHCQWNIKQDSENTERHSTDADTVEEVKCHNDAGTSGSVQRESDKNCKQETKSSVGTACNSRNNASNHIKDKSKWKTSEVSNTGVSRSEGNNTSVPVSVISNIGVSTSEVSNTCVPSSVFGNSGASSSDVSNTGIPNPEISNTGIHSPEISNTCVSSSESSNSGVLSLEVSDTGVPSSQFSNSTVPNPEISNTCVSSSEFISTGVPNPEISNTHVSSSEVSNSGAPSSVFSKTGVPNSEISNTGIYNSEISNTGIHSPEISNTQVSSSEFSNTGNHNPEISNTGIPNPEISNTRVSSSEFSNSSVATSEFSNTGIPNPEISNTRVSSSEFSNSGVPSSEFSNNGIPNPEISNTCVPSSEVIYTGVSTSEGSYTGVPNPKISNTDVPMTEVSNTGVSSPQISNTSVPSSEVSNAAVLSSEFSKTSGPSSVINTTYVPSSKVSYTGVSTSEGSYTGVPNPEISNTDVPMTEVSNTGVSSPQISNTSVPSSEASNAGVPSSEVSNSSVPRSEVSNTGVPSSVFSNTGVSSSESRNSGVRSLEVCNTGVPSSEVCNTGVPSSEVCNTGVPSSEACNTGVPSSEVSNTGVPSSKVCNTGVPSSEVCNTGVPNSEFCNTGVPSSEVCNTGVPSSEVCNTGVPSSEVYNTGVPSSEVCNTGVPSSEVCNTGVPSSEVCNTGVPSSEVCNTGVPSSEVYNTDVLSSEVCNTAEQKNVNADSGKWNSGTRRHDIDSEGVDAFILQVSSWNNTQICCDCLPRQKKFDIELNKVLLPPNEECEVMCSFNRDTTKSTRPNSKLQNVDTVLHSEHLPSETDCQTGSDSACYVSASNEIKSSHSCGKPGKSENEITQTKSGSGHNVHSSTIGQKQFCESKNMNPRQKIPNHEHCATLKIVCDNTSVKNKADTRRHKVRRRDKDRHVQGERKERNSRRHEDLGYRKNSSTKHEKSVYESLIKEKMKAINREIKSKAVEPTIITDDLSKVEKPSPYKQYIIARTSKETNGEEGRHYVETVQVDRTDIQRNIHKEIIRQCISSVQADHGTDPKVLGNMNRGAARQSVKSVQADRTDPKELGNMNRGIERHSVQSVQADRTDPKELGNMNRGIERHSVQSVQADRTDPKVLGNMNRGVARQSVNSLQADCGTDPKVLGNMNRGVARQSVKSVQGDKTYPRVFGNINRGTARQCDRSVQVNKTDSQVLGNVINKGVVRQFVRSWQVSSGDVQDHKKNRPSDNEDWEQELLTVNSSLTASDGSVKHVISNTQEDGFLQNNQSGKCQEKKIQTDGTVISQKEIQQIQNCPTSVGIFTTEHNNEREQSKELQEQINFPLNPGRYGKSNSEHMKSHCYAVTDLERRNNKRNDMHVNKDAPIMSHQPVQKVFHNSTETCEQQKLNLINPYSRERSNPYSAERSSTEMKGFMHGHSEDWESSLLDIKEIERLNFKREITDQVVPTYEMCKPEILEDSVHGKNTSTCVLHSTSLIVNKSSLGEFDWESSLLDISDFGNTDNLVDDRMKTALGESIACRESITEQYLPPPPPPEELEIYDVKQILDPSKSVSIMNSSVPEVEIPEDAANDLIPSLSPVSKEDVIEKLALEKSRPNENILEHESESEESYLPFSENTLSGVPTISDFDESMSDGNADYCVIHSQERSVEEAIQKQACEHTDEFSDKTKSKNDLNNNNDKDESYGLSDQENSHKTQEEPRQYFRHSPYKHIGEKFGWRIRDDEYFNYVNTTTGVYKCTCPLDFVQFWIWRSCACCCGEIPLLCDIRNGTDFGMCYSHPGMSEDYRDKKVQFRPRGILGIAFPPPPPGELWDKMQHGSESTKYGRTVGDAQNQNTPKMPGSYPTMQTTTKSYNCGTAPPGFSALPLSYPPPCNLLSPPRECFMRYRSPYSFHSPPESEDRKPKCEGSQTRKVLVTVDGPGEQILHSLEAKRESEEKIKMPLKKRPILLDQFPDHGQTDPLVQNQRMVQKKDMSYETLKYNSNISAEHSSVKMLNPLGKLFQGIRFPTLSPTREPSSITAAKFFANDDIVSKMTEKLDADHGNMEKLQLHSPKLVDYNLSETDESEEENVKFNYKVEEASGFPCENSLDGSESSGDKRKFELEEGELVEEEVEEYIANKKRLVEASSQQFAKENIDKVPRYVPPHKRLSWPQDKEKNNCFTGVPFQDVNKRIVFYGDKRRSLESNTNKSEEFTDRRTNVYSRSNPYLCTPSSPFWSSDYRSTSPLLGYNQPACLYPAGYFIDNNNQKSSPSAHSYGESHRAVTDRRLQRARLSSESFSRWQIKSEDSPRRTSWRIKEGSPPKDMLVPQRLRFLQKSKLLDSDSDSGASILQSDWKIRFKNKCRTYQETFIDSHCHIDFLFNRQGFRGSWSKYRKVNEETFPDNYEGCVAVFCYPGSFRSEGLWKDVSVEDNVWLAFGCHPKHATEFTPKTEEGLRICLQNEKVVALGEIGLDYSGIFMQHEAVQKVVFMKQIQIALELNKPLVIHCRQAEEDCLDILERMVPRNYRIHCHCFTGNYDSAKKWMDLFPNLYIGLTPLVTFKTAEPTHEVARFIPLERLLLETDAPYFIPRKIPKDEMQFSHPGMAITVAESVAWFKRCSVGEVLTACRQNTRNMYGI